MQPVDRLVSVHDLEALTNEVLEEEETTTTSGYVTHRLGGFPKPGDTLTVGNFELRVDETAGPKVARLTLKRLPPPPAEDEAGS